MSGNISVSKTKELQNLLQELFRKLQLDYKTVHKGKETISFTDATNDIINKAEENFGKIKNEKSESYLEFINTIKKDCNTNPQNPESVNFSFSEGTLRSIFNAHKKQSNRRTVGKKIAHVFALYLGYVGWDGFVNEKLIEDTHPEKGGDKSVLSESKSSYQVSIQEEPKGSDDVQHKSNISTRKKTKRVVVYVLTSIVIVCLIGFLLDSYYMSQDRFSDDVNGILILPIQRDHQNSFRSDLLNTIETKIDTNLNVQVKKYESISSLFSSQYTVERAKRIGESQNARIVIWGELISGKNKLWLHLTTVDSKGLEYFLEKDIKMDALDIGEFDLPSSLVETPQVILSFIRGYLSLLEKDYIKAIDYLTFVDEQKEIEEIDKMKLLNLIGASYMGLAQTNDRNFNTQKAISTYTEVINLGSRELNGSTKTC